LNHLRKLPSNTFKELYFNSFNFVLSKNYNILLLFNLFNFILYKQYLNWYSNFKVIEIKNLDIDTNKKIQLIVLYNMIKLNNINLKTLAYKKKKQAITIFFKNFIWKTCKKFLNLRHNSYLNNNSISKKFLLKIILRLENKKKKKNFFNHQVFKHHWYTPNYLEIDYKTLRAVFISYPTDNEVYYGFPCSFDKIISFYKERAL
jgi:hypothetical protein